MGLYYSVICLIIGNARLQYEKRSLETLDTWAAPLERINEEIRDRTAAGNDRRTKIEEIRVLFLEPKVVLQFYA